MKGTDEAAELEVDRVSKSFGGIPAVERVSFVLHKGQFLSLLGPSGCGKTTTLRMIAGFITPDTGSIRLRGKDITGDPPYRRDVGLLFQSYALFPHMTVFDNVAFGPKMRGASKAEMREKVQWALSLVRLSGFDDRKPHELSGGQQQRVAVARVLAAGASILLLDEPFSNLDAKLRKHMQEDLRELQLRLGIATIHVTHDQEEAMSMSDRVIIMNAGRVEQEGTTSDIYLAPRTAFVAEFMGRCNTFVGTIVHIDRDRSTVELETNAGRLLAAWPDAGEAPPQIRVFVRPEHISLAPKGAFAGRPNVLSGELKRYVYLGPYTTMHVAVRDDHDLVVSVPNTPAQTPPPAIGSQLDVHLPPESLKPIRE
jgi:ABC-type Fe3+/spermidine/putrescine transport system ATPase subunit